MDEPTIGLEAQSQLPADLAAQAESAPVVYEAASVSPYQAEAVVVPQQAAEATEPIPTTETPSTVQVQAHPVEQHATAVHTPATFGSIVEDAVKNVNTDPEATAHALEAEVLQSQGYFQSAA